MHTYAIIYLYSYVADTHTHVIASCIHMYHMYIVYIEMHMNLQTYRYTDTGAYIITHIYICIYIYMHVCVCIHTHVKVSVVFVLSSHGSLDVSHQFAQAPRGQHGNWRDHCGIDELRPGSLGCRHHLLLCLCLRDSERNQLQMLQADYGRPMVDPGTKFQSVSFFVPSAFLVVLLRVSLLHLFFSTTPRCKLWTG